MRHSKTMQFLVMTLIVATAAQIDKIAKVRGSRQERFMGRAPPKWVGLTNYQYQAVAIGRILTQLSAMHKQQLKIMDVLNTTNDNSGDGDAESDGLTGDYLEIFKLSRARLETLHKDTNITGMVDVLCCKNGTLRKNASCGGNRPCGDVCGSRENNNAYVTTYDINNRDNSDYLCDKVTGVSKHVLFCDPKDEICQYGIITQEKACTGEHCGQTINNEGKHIIDEPCCCRFETIRCAGSNNRVECAWNGFHGSCPTDD